MTLPQPPVAISRLSGQPHDWEAGLVATGLEERTANTAFLFRVDSDRTRSHGQPRI